MRKHIRNTSQALALVLLFASSSASAVVWVGGGVEYMTTGGYYDVYVADEHHYHRDFERTSGYLPYVEANADIPLTERTRLVLAGRAYGGDVDTTFYQDAPFTNINGSSEIKGVRGEVGATFAPLPEGEEKEVVFLATVGLDSSSNDFTQGVYQRKVELKIPFVRLGAQLDAPVSGGWTSRGGLIIPVATSLYNEVRDKTYYPEEGISYYVGLGRRIGRFIEVGFNYEGYRISDVDPDFPGRERVETDTYQLYLKAGF